MTEWLYVVALFAGLVGVPLAVVVVQHWLERRK